APCERPGPASRRRPVGTEAGRPVATVAQRGCHSGPHNGRARAPARPAGTLVP
ncbi:hypothetical protein HMPREF9005_2338, partial [Actinomyces sp. oral taxon 178 str. F0338]